MPYPARHPILGRVAAYGSPHAVAAWREHVDNTPGLPRITHSPTTAVKLARVRVDVCRGNSAVDLAAVAELAIPGVSLIVQWHDRAQSSTGTWVSVHDGRTRDLGVPGDACVGFLLSHGGKFRHADTHARAWPSITEAIAADHSPMGTSRRRFITFDLDHVWTPAAEPAPVGTTWMGGALDVTDVELGRFLGARARANQFAWEPWTVAALSQWLDHEGARACDVPETVAATAGLLADDLAPVLADRHEPASQVIAVVRALAAQGLTVDEMAGTIPALLA